MELRDILLTVQYLSVIFIFIECWVVFRKWKSMLHAYLFFACISTFVCSLGYLMEMKATTEEAYMTALKLSYSGRIWVALALFLFALRMCRITVPGLVTKVLVVLHGLAYACVLTTGQNELYYKNGHFETTQLGLSYIHDNGIVHDLFMILQSFYIIFGITCLIRSCIRSKSRIMRRRISMIVFAFTVDALFFGIQTLKVFDIPYDFSMIGHLLGCLFMLVAIFGFDILGTSEIAKDFVVDRISEGIVAIDRHGEVQYYNEPIGRMYPELTKPHATLPQEIADAIAEGKTITRDDRIYSPEENPLVYEGETVGKLYAVVDDTEHFKYMEELEKQKEIADSANKAKSAFLANMSHEIRTPINAVLGMDEMILRETKETETRAYAGDIMSAGKTLLSLINDILDLSKVEEGKMEIIPVQYDLSSLINDLVNMVRDRAAKKGLSFVVDVDGNIPNLLFGDEIRVRQCALNILTNAVKYTEKGSVTMGVSFEEKDEKHIMLKFSVKDTGIGMKEEDLERLFAPYQRIEEARNRSIEGTGLGMSITRQLLDLMGTSLVVKSEYGKGSEFSFAVEQEVVNPEKIGDYTQRFANAGTEHEYHELFHAPKARILVVDDTEMNLTVIKSLLKNTGIRIDTALSGRDALTLASNNDYDAMFIDHMMADMDGIETLHALRKEGKNTETPAVALTANAVSGAREMYLNAGFTDYLSKPVDGEHLEKMLQRLLPKDKLEKPETDGGSAVKPLERPKLLAVDDEETVCELIRNIMEPVYDIKTTHSGKDAVKLAKGFMPDIILLDIHLKDENGFNVMHELKKDETVSDIPVLIITGDNDTATEENGFRSGASDFIRKPFAPDVLKARVRRIIELDHYRQSIEKEVDSQTNRSRRLSREMMLALSKTVDTKDHYTDGHSRRVAALCAEIGRRLGKTSAEQVELYEIGLLHDIGKIGIHEDIIHKNTRLTDDEFASVKAHTLKGDEILKEIIDMPRLHEGARWHHERYDGSGYPDGLKGDEIPEYARIACVADCYDAMTSTRTYSVPRSREDVRAEIARCSGSWFDPQIADVLLGMIDEDKDYKMNEHAESGMVWKGYDRLWGNLNERELTGETNEHAGLPEWVKNLKMTDIHKGVKNCGSEEGYLSVLSVFHQTAASKADDIERLYREGNIRDYTIMVHALKSSARIIGAGELSKFAEKLEIAGKREDLKFIDENTWKLLQMYREFDGQFAPLDEKNEELPELEQDAVKEAYQTIAEIAQSMDYELLEEMLKDLHGYRMAPEDEKRIKNIGKLLTELDWDGIAEAALKAADGSDKN